MTNGSRQVLDSNYFNTQAFEKDRDGLVLDYKSVLDAHPNTGNTASEYIKQSDYRLQPGAFANQKIKKERSKIAEPHIIATFDPHDTQDLPDITASGFTIKHKGDDFIAIPIELKTALTKVHAAANDLLQLYGKEQFKQAEITFVLQRNDIETGKAPRPHFAGWHTHVNGSEKTDLLYLFHDVLGTEYKLQHHNGDTIEATEISLPNNVISRMGGEIQHRSKPENPHDTLRREWGGLKVLIDKQPITAGQNNKSCNLSMVKRDSPLFEKFSLTAQNIIKETNTIQPLGQPQRVLDLHEIDHNPA